MSANYEVEMLTGNRVGGEHREAAALEIQERRRGCRNQKDEEREPGRRLGMSNLIGTLSFHLKTLSLLLKKIWITCAWNYREYAYSSLLLAMWIDFYV